MTRIRDAAADDRLMAREILTALAILGLAALLAALAAAL